MSGARTPSEAERQTFVTKLAQFRGRLNSREQQMLDELVAAGRQAHEHGDVQVYWLCGTTAVPGPASDLWTAYAGTATYTGLNERS